MSEAAETPVETPTAPETEVLHDPNDPWYDPEPGETTAEAAPETPEAPKPAPPKAKEAPKPAETKPQPTPGQLAAMIRRREKAASRTERELELVAANVRKAQEQLAADEELKRTDPYAYAKKMGLDFRKVVEHVAKDGDEDPSEKRYRELEEKYAALEARLNPLIEKEQLTAKQAQAVEDYNQEITFIQSELGDLAEEFPTLTDLDPQEVAQEARALYYAYDQSGQSKQLDDVLSELEEKYRKLDERLAARRKPQSAGSQSKRLGPPARNGAVQSAKPGTRQASPSLTERSISQRAAVDRQLTDDEEMELLASRLEIG